MQTLPDSPLGDLSSLAAARDDLRQRQQLRESFPLFFVTLFKDSKGRPIILQPFHERIISALQNRRRVLVNIFRGAGKSTLITHAYVCWYIGNHRDARVIVACKNESLAKDFLSRVDQTLRSKAYQDIFGNLVPTERTGKWNETEKVVVGRSPHTVGLTLLGIGAGAATAGRRADLIIVDDCADAKNSSTEIQRRHLSTWFFEELEPVCEPDATMFVPGTRWDHKDIYDEIRNTWAGRYTPDEFEYILQPVLERIRGEGELILREIETEEGPSYRSVWEARFPTDMLLRWWQSKPLEFTQQMLCAPVDTSLAFLQREWLDNNLIDENAIPWDRLAFFFGVDPSWTDKKTGDYFAICIGGKDPLTQLAYILEIVRDHADPDHSWKLITGAASRLMAEHGRGPELINMESNAAQSFLVRRVQEESNLPVNPIKTTLTKTERFTNMSVYFTTGRVKLRGQWIDGQLVPHPSLDPLFYEWTVFRGEKTADHDDCLDATDFMLKAAAYGAEPAEAVATGLSQPKQVKITQDGHIYAAICAGCGAGEGNLRLYQSVLYCASCLTRLYRRDKRGWQMDRLRSHFLS